MNQKQPSKKSGTLFELVFGVIFLLLAVGIWIVFAENPWNLPFTALALIGLGVFVIVIVAIFLILYFSGKKRGDKK